MRFMKNSGWVALGAALALSACGSHSSDVSALPGATTPTTIPPFVPTSGTPGTPPGTVDHSWDNAIQMSFSLNGTNSGNETYTSQPITTDNLLKVRLTALPAGTNIGSATNFTANYGCVGFTVTALGMAVDSQPLSSGGSMTGMCNNGSSQVIDFSGRLSPGHGTITLTVSKARYDWYCMLYMYYPWLMGGNATMYCPLHPVYQYHTVEGELQVQTNGTSGS
jgi:hypothetical protein